MSKFFKSLFGRRLPAVVSPKPVAVPFELVSTTGQQALTVLEAIDAEGRHTPVLHGAPEAYERLALDFDCAGEGDIEDLSGAVADIDIEGWLGDGWQEALDGWEAEPGLNLEGEWPAGATPTRRPFCLAASRRFEAGEFIYLPEVRISKLPTREHWLAPSFWKFGGWNACPDPEIHSALLLRWWKSHGARVRAITTDTIELFVARPVTTREDALQIAREHYVYCSEGDGTIQERAADLLGSDHWLFWWD